MYRGYHTITRDPLSFACGTAGTAAVPDQLMYLSPW